MSPRCGAGAVVLPPPLIADFKSDPERGRGLAAPLVTQTGDFLDVGILLPNV